MSDPFPARLSLCFIVRLLFFLVGSPTICVRGCRQCFHGVAPPAVSGWLNSPTRTRACEAAPSCLYKALSTPPPDQEPVANTHNSVTLAILPFCPNSKALNLLIIHPKTEPDTFQMLSHIEGNPTAVLSQPVFPKQLAAVHDNISVMWAVPNVFIIAMRSKCCNCTQISSSSCLFPMLCSFVYMDFIEILDCVKIPVRIQRDAPQSILAVMPLGTCAYWRCPFFKPHFVPWVVTIVLPFPYFMSVKPGYVPLPLQI